MAVRAMTDTERRWLLSQNTKHFRHGDDKLPPVLASCTSEAARIVDEILRRGSDVGPNGEIIISWWAVHRLAIRLQEIAMTGVVDGEPITPPPFQPRSNTP
jgi:hypothetical protein